MTCITTRTDFLVRAFGQDLHDPESLARLEKALGATFYIDANCQLTLVRHH